MTDTDILIQNLRRENEVLKAELEWKQKEIELARRHEEMRWISVEDRMPEEWIDDDNNTYIDYLIYMPYFKAAGVGVYNADEESWLFRGIEVKVSHWMPLPEPPKEVNDGNKTDL